jgi:phosphatidylserine/phosphatidylglycerophosphate/cardiolipin synthase-like enzyme
MDPLLSARFALHEQLILCRNGARMTTEGLEPEPGAALEPNDPLAVEALQQALVEQGFSLGTSGPEGDGIDGGYGQHTVEAVLAFKQREGLAQPGEASFDGVTSVGTTTRLDEIYRHELVDQLLAELAGGPFDPGGRAGDLAPTDREGLFAAPAVAGGRLLDATIAATYAPPTIDAAWEAEGGASGELGGPIGHPFTLESGRAAMDFEGGRVIDDPAGFLIIQRWAVDVASGPFDLGEPLEAAASDPLAPAGTRVPFERGIAFADPDGNAYAFPDELLKAWSDALAAGTEVGMPTDLPSLDPATGTIAFPFEQTTLSIGDVEIAAPPDDVGAAGNDHLRFVVPFITRTPKPDQIRPITVKNSTEHFINGEAVFTEMIADIRAATAAKDKGFVYIAGWWLRHDFQIQFGGGGPMTTLGAELEAALKAGVEVRGMVWNPLTARLVTGRFNKPSVEALNKIGADFLYDHKVQFAGSHHQKLTICFDGSTVSSWVGGIDWNEDRIQSNFQDKPGGKLVPHPGYPSFDNMVRVRGGGAHELLVGWLDRWEKRTGKMGSRGRNVGGAPTPGSVITQVSHTYGPGYPFSVGVTTSATTIEHVIRNARNYVYIEDQYFFMTPKMEATLIERMSKGVTVIVVTTPNEVCELPYSRQARFDAIARVAGASTKSGVGGLNIFESLGPGQSPTGPHAYTHCKVVIADDEAAVIGTVNSSNRSWTHDTEVSTLFIDAIGLGGTEPGARGFPRQARCDLWQGHGALGAITGDHTVDVPAFLSGATGGGLLRGYDMLNRPPMAKIDHVFEPVFSTVVDPA